jgi:hypothetical protein
VSSVQILPFFKADETVAARNAGLERDPRLREPIRFGFGLTGCDAEIRGIGGIQLRLQHRGDLFAAFHGLDVPGETHEIAPVAVRLEQLNYGGNVPVRERSVQALEHACYNGDRIGFGHGYSSIRTDGQYIAKAGFSPALELER